MMATGAEYSEVLGPESVAVALTVPVGSFRFVEKKTGALPLASV
jgi:hypothetical protein